MQKFAMYKLTSLFALALLAGRVARAPAVRLFFAIAFFAMA